MHRSIYLGYFLLFILLSNAYAGEVVMNQTVSNDAYEIVNDFIIKEKIVTELN